MKAFKGCTNQMCEAYKENHYKDSDEFCTKCGERISFVCAECWKPMEDGKKKYCISCAAKRAQRRAEKWDAVKKTGGKVAAVVGSAVVAVPQLVKNSDKLAKDVKKAADAAVEVIKMVKK